VLYVLLHERDVKEGKVRVEGLDDEKFNHERCTQQNTRVVNLVARTK
jgi:hypothetical protein